MKTRTDGRWGLLLGTAVWLLATGCGGPLELDPCTNPEDPGFCDATACPANAEFDVRCQVGPGPCEDRNSDFFCDENSCPDNFANDPQCAQTNYCEQEPGGDRCCTQFPGHPTCTAPVDPTESCLECHAAGGDYADPDAIEHPHPWRNLACTDCHAGDAQGNGKAGSHVPAPPRLSDAEIFNGAVVDFWGEFNRRTLTGIDKIQDYTVEGTTYSGLDWLQFINPGDLRVVAEGRSCGMSGCHADRSQAVAAGVIATEIGLLSGARFAIGQDNAYTARANQDNDTLADVAPRAVENPNYDPADRKLGEVQGLQELSEYAGDAFYAGGKYTQYTADVVNTSRYDGNVLDPEYDGKINSELTSHLLNTAFTQQCGDCHLYSAGANNRYADFRGSGCTSCHFEYAYDGKSRSRDPNIDKLEPADPDAIAPGERSHPRDHVIRNVAKTVNGVFVGGISDKNCVGCHQGSNRTVLQFWGYRVDPNADTVNNVPNPYLPVNFTTAATPDPASKAPPLRDLNINNDTFNGLNVDTQIIATEDYDGDGLDDTPPDIHHQRGMYCIDCHGSHELHGDGRVYSRMDQQVAVRCESCHGTIEDYAEVDGNGYAVDSWGRRLSNVQKDPQGSYYLRSRVTGELHYIAQVRDVVYDSGKVNPKRQVSIFNQLGSYAMGRIDDDPTNGQGPLQANPQLNKQGFSHSGNAEGQGGLACASCHGGWQNNCVGCHLDLEFDGNGQDYDFSNLTGEQVYTEIAATFRLVNPVEQFLGTTSRGKVSWMQPETKMFFSWTDYQGNTSDKLTYSDRLGYGSNTTAVTRGNSQALGFNQMSPHSIQGKLRPFANKNDDELRYYGLGAVKDCVSCHLVDGADQNGNAVNTVNDPLAVGRVRKLLGLGDTVNANRYLFDVDGEPIITGVGNAANAAYQLDLVVDEATGKSFASNIHARLDNREYNPRTDQPYMAGPLNADQIAKQLDQYVLDTVYQR